MKDQNCPASAVPTAEASKAVVRHFFEVFSSGDLQRIGQCLHDELRWWVAGSLPGLSGTYDKPGICTLLGGVAAAYVGGALPMTVVAMIAEGDRVAVELQCRATLHNGRVYANQLHVSIELCEGKLWRVREYLDTAHCHEIFLAA
ncbi:nuclear transport factor 2 family protein [Pseudomonas typographi]|uniref:SnoaL-like domain-containing protein n=1 Tax=Pseudomonas typographi TaxID=2715964 RepID=A0ABR7Z1P0_9PSED|nr:nuclear transport factor 2 family protein [Pseudomonas typographi]MBD1551502.1 SnoaL-like domain-containing protein [Pseudomonas typographi]MBD1587512.1 SnoaL-like domain-containing protein [Pseudomonas typographi]MBD1599405.1 SnoaL-like domain-containing protein [Pseudomonas typographi]